MMSPRSRFWSAFLCVWAPAWSLGPPAAAQPAAQPPAEPSLEQIYYDTVDENGQLSGGRAELLVGARDALETIPAHVTMICERDARSAIGIALVTVGDGYTAAQLGLYATHADASLVALFNQEPFHTYAPYFDVYRVDVISSESGVDHDPTQGIYRNTALDMGFWCSGIERLLCVNVSKAYAHANNAPAVDLVLAIANSTKYGGAGYPSSDLATVSGGNSAAAEVVLHELGHSLGNLADEYDYGDGATYSGSEPSERNVSKLTAAQMAAAGTKWATWLGTNDASFDGLVSAYQGAAYYQYGLYRPTSSSKMRALSRPFNLPSAEALIIQIYHMVRPIDDSTPTAPVLHGTETVYVTPLAPVGHALDVRWVLDGVALEGATATTLDLTSLTLTPGTHTLSVVVTDNTWMVRDAAARAAWLTDSRAWTVAVALRGDLNCDGTVNIADINPFVQCLANYAAWRATYPSCDPLVADINADGTYGQGSFGDINPFVALLSRGG